MQVVVRVINPAVPSPKQVRTIQKIVNENLFKKFGNKNLQMQMKVQRIHVSVVEGSEVNATENLNNTLDEAEAAQPSSDLMEPIKPEVPEQEQEQLQPFDETEAIEPCLKEACESASDPS